MAVSKKNPPAKQKAPKPKTVKVAKEHELLSVPDLPEEAKEVSDTSHADSQPDDATTTDNTNESVEENKNITEARSTRSKDISKPTTKKPAKSVTKKTIKTNKDNKPMKRKTAPKKGKPKDDNEYATDDSNTEDKQPNVKKPKLTKARKDYRVIVMNDDSVHQFTTSKDADAFVADYEDNIKDTLPFSSKVKMTAHCKILEDIKKEKDDDQKKKKGKGPKTPEKSMFKTKKYSENDMRSAEKIANSIRKKNPTGILQMFTKTATTSEALIIILSHELPDKNRPWWHKGDMFAGIAISYVEVEEVKDPIVKEAMQNMRPMSKRDPEGDPDKVLQKESLIVVPGKDSSSKPTYKHTGRWFPEIIAATWVTIPWKTLGSKQNEDNWIKTTTLAVGQALVDLQRDDSIWHLVYKETCPSELFYTKSWKQYVPFFKMCGVHTEATASLNRIIVKDDATALTNYLYENKLPNGKKKYVEEDEPDNSAEDDGSSEQEDDDNEEEEHEEADGDSDSDGSDSNKKDTRDDSE